MHEVIKIKEIGKTPDYNLDVVGSGKFSNSLLVSNVKIQSSDIYESETTNDHASIWINYRGYSGLNSYFRDFGIGDGKYNPLLFASGSDSKVGIKTMNPKTELDVSGDVHCSRLLVDTLLFGVGNPKLQVYKRSSGGSGDVLANFYNKNTDVTTSNDWYGVVIQAAGVGMGIGLSTSGTKFGAYISNNCKVSGSLLLDQGDDISPNISHTLELSAEIS